MESLYRKYRPLTFESVVGQQHIVSTLEHAVAEGRLSHAYLFCGPRGTGKTTMARILAKALLCEKSGAARAEGASGCMPDGTCPECEAIAEGVHPDVYELDAASRTGVDNVREEIINSVSFAPVRGAYKVYIIDEVHMLTTAAFNALLKTLEEPPSHVIFVLCTTDPQKILETILSRCQRFDFHRISNDDIIGRLRYICEQEGFEFDEEALEIVARHARGGMRDALSTLEQLSVFGNGAVRAGDARALLGEASSTVLAEFARSIAARDVVSLFGLVRIQVDEGNDLMELTRDLVSHMRDVYTVRVAGARTELLDCTPEEVAALAGEAELFETADRLARVLTALDDAALEMRDASDVRLVLEIACTRLARPESDLTIEALAERLDRIESQLAAGIAPAPMDAASLVGQGAAGDGAASAVRTSSVAAVAPKPAPAPEKPAPRPAPASGSGLPWERPAAAAPVAAPAPAPVPAAAPSSAPARDVPVATASPAPAAHPSPSPAAEASAARPSSVPKPVAPAPAVPPKAAPVAPAAPAHPEAPRRTEPQPAAAPTGDAGELQRKWNAVVKRVTARKASCGGLILHARAQSDDGSNLRVSLPAGSDWALKMIGRQDAKDLVDACVAEVFGSRVVEICMDEAPQRPASPVPRPAAAGAPAASAPATAPAPVSAPAAPSVPAVPTAPAPAPSAPAAPSSPAPAPTASAPAAAGSAPAPASSAPAAPVPAGVDHSSGPTIVPEPDVDAQRKAWEEDQVPYDDATIAAYEADEDAPPIDLPAAPVSPSPAPTAAPTPAAAPAAAPPAPKPDAPAAPAGAMPWSGFVAPEEEVPQNEAEAKEMLGNIFGAGIVFKPGE